MRIKGLVLRDPMGPSTVEDIDILSTTDYGTSYGVLMDGICVRREWGDYFRPEPLKRYQPFLIHPVTGEVRFQ
jgi:hypothetical protein